ncbi:MAG: SCP2 sterol-binding domain-containing protein [Deltaproteobacteria bacterium]|nr:SCP2 sterol-binding domain-containing protein [Deltaproteobacteria bacterium]
MTTKEIFNEMQKRMDANPGKLAGMKGVFQFDIGGADAGIYAVAIGDGKAVISEGASSSADITIIMASNDFDDMVGGRLDPMAAFMGGKLKVKGDMMLAMQLQGLLT